MEDIISKQRALAFDYLYDAVVVTDLEGIIIDWNVGSELLYGYSKEEAIGKPVCILHVPEDLDHVTKDVLDGIARDGKWSGEVNMLRKDGTIGWIESMCVPLLDEDNQPIGALGINRDITKRVEQERKLLLQSKFAQMGEMLAMIAHQWRQPLNAISTTAVDAIIRLELDQLKNTTESEIQESKAYLLNQFTKIEGYTLDLSEVINGFREYFKAEKTVKSIGIDDIIKKSLSILDSSIKEHDVSIELNLDDVPKITNYQFELLQVVVNIIKNAIDAMHEMSVKDAKIKFTLSRSDKGEKLIIFNGGTTISQENLTKIFDPYFSTKGVNGMGIGLYMSKVIMQEHCNGQLDVSVQEDGVAFSIDLPIEIR